MTEKETVEKKEKMLTVRVIETRGSSSLVEWLDKLGPRRRYVPAECVDASSRIKASDLQAGLPYGTPWELYQPEAINPAELAKELRASGIWNRQDLMLHSQRAKVIVLKLASLMFADLIKFSEEKINE